MTSGLEPGIDFSGYTPNVTRQRIRQAMDQYGIEWASIGAIGNRYLATQIDECVAAGIRVDSYIIPRDWYAPVPGLVGDALRMLENWRPRITNYIWLDVERLPDQIPRPDRVLQWLYAALEQCDREGWQAGIYTSKREWNDLTNNSQEFSDRPLWEASYGTYRTYIPNRIGAWQKRAGVQWAGSATLCEMNVDLNTWETRDQSMTDEQIKELIGNCLGAIAGNGAKIDELANAVNSAAELSGAKITPKGLYFISNKAWPYPVAP